MKKFFKIIGVLILFVAVFIGGFALYISISGIPKYDVQEITYQHQSSPEAIARGKKLASMLCAGCHMDVESGKLTGRQMTDAPPEFGIIYSQNITADPTYGIGNWTDAQIAYLIRTGIKPDGLYAPPYMAKLPHLADEDLNAIISFLRSDDPMVMATAVEDKPCEPSFLVKVLCRVAFTPFDMPNSPIALPDTANTLELGRYLTYNLECFSCHSADFTTNNYLDPTLSEGYMAGGNLPLDEEGRQKPTPNLTPDMETGIGGWSKDKFVKAVKYGIVEGDMALEFPMQPYSELTDYEAEAIYDYLMTIPAIKNKVERKIY